MKKNIVRLSTKVWVVALAGVQALALGLLALSSLRWFLAVEACALLLLGVLVSSKFADVLGQLAAQRRQLDRIQAGLGRAQWQLQEAMTVLKSPQGRMQRMGGRAVPSGPSAAATSGDGAGPVVGRAAGDSSDFRSREELFLDAAGSAVQRLEAQSFAVVLGSGQQLPESLAKARRLTPSFVTMQLDKLQPGGVIVDEAAFAEGPWAGADRAGGEHLVASLLQLVDWCSDNSASLVLVRRDGTVGENTGLIRSFTTLHVPLRNDLPDGIPVPAVVRGALDLASEKLELASKEQAG
ncbi:MAG: hypothetical protein Q3997_00250 [Propionibacteriaceae bacterium]|nr:hypothetical protein [Propionibacteriaceae bacterium]